MAGQQPSVSLRHQFATDCANNNNSKGPPGQEYSPKSDSCCSSSCPPWSNSVATHSSACSRSSSHVASCPHWLRDANNNPTWPETSHATTTSLVPVPPPSANSPLWYFHRKGKHARHLQHRRWSGPISLLNAQQQHFIHFPVGVQSQSQQPQQEVFAAVQVENLGPWQRSYSFLVPIEEDEEDRLLNSAAESNQEQQQQSDGNMVFQLGLSAMSSSSSCDQLAYHHLNAALPQSSLLSPQSASVSHDQLTGMHLEPMVNQSTSAFADKQAKAYCRRKVKIRKSRSESFLAVANRYKRLPDQEEEDNTEDEADQMNSSEDQSDNETDWDLDTNIPGTPNSTKVSSARPPNYTHTTPLTKSGSKFVAAARFGRKTMKSSASLSSLISSTIQESFKMIRSLKLH